METKIKSSEFNAVELRDQLFKSRVEFSQQALNECLTFLRLDNKIINHFEGIIGTVKEDIAKNPDRFYGSGLSQNIKNESMDVSGSGLFDDIGETIKEVILKDKDLVFKIIDKLIPDIF